eukprot:CAMPEP_0201590470 /NCGR_PEP_ID=MMETSP0190_2-20130828/178101_1 /ASSEMBLY_ACC=CAM_ASM_000263 /TAXON_ID=37353 /ORGANISM="Rosalina sp." /LENGTH=354 /DNA_ID=CAMNT_0048046685 /DNA_START=97 /DNA_END=1161 /DNA_ORIENTATION=+
MISALANNELNEDFFNELQDSLYEKQQEIIAEMFEEKKNMEYDENGEAIKPEKTPKKKKRKPKLSKIENLNFEYCDFPTYDDKGQKIKKGDDNDEAKDDRFTSQGYTKGNVGKLSISQTQRRKKFSEKSYEEQKMLLQMYIDELQSPVLPQIMQHIENKKLVCCEKAWNHFMDIVNLSAGPSEWKRCKELQSKITIVKDQVSERTQSLKGKSMSHINKCVFGTGDTLRCLTLTAIASFVRKAEQQGVKYFVNVHSVRPLTERYQREYEKKKKENEEKNSAQMNDNNLNQKAYLIHQQNGFEQQHEEIGMIVEEDELHESEQEEINGQLQHLNLRPHSHAAEDGSDENEHLEIID